jgi:hypothetical protein
MSESWRSILERAAENLSIELDQMTAPAFSHAHAATLGGRRLSPQLSFAESRELLARELQVSSAQRSRLAERRVEASTALTVPVTASKPKVQPSRTQPRKRTFWQTFFATMLSAVITGGLTAYVLLAQGVFGKEEILAFAAYADQGFTGDEAQPAALNASLNGAAVVNRSTENALFERASYQLRHGDGEGGRAVFEVLANHGSPRGAFALAETYDPARLAEHADWGLKSDMRLARQWYKRASELGSLPAYDRLRDLDKRASLPQKAEKL